MSAIKWEDEEAPKFQAIGISTVQGDPILTLVTVSGNSLQSTHYINASSSHTAEVRKTLLKILEQVLK